MNWLTKKDDTTSDCYNTEDRRENYLFPLPLPLRYDSSFKYARSNGRFDEYIELLVARTQNLTELYPNYKDMQQYGRNPVTNELGWYFNTRGWMGGMEFTLRRQQYLPSLQTLCRELVPKGEHTFNVDGSLNKSIGQESVSNSQETEDDDYVHIVNYVRSCGPVGMKYVREILRIVRNVNWCARTSHNKIFDFTEDWSTHPETSSIHKVVFSALGGSDILNQQTDKKGKLFWTFTFTGKMDESATTKEMKKEMKKIRSRKQNDMWNRWDHFRISILPVMTENELAHQPTCAATDSTIVLPTADKLERTVLTLKIEGMTCSEGYYNDEPFKQTASVQVPASLNFFQLHRVVCQTMNCEAHAARETHEWQVPNIGVRHQRPITDEACLTVQIGETYFVEDSSREDYGCRYKNMFSKGNAIRQRISHTGIYCDRDMPLFEDLQTRWNNMREDKSGSVYACIHSTCINSVFIEPGKVAVLQDGLVNYCTKWKLTCMKIEEYDGLLPINPNMNCVLAKCLRGNPHDSIDVWNPWSVENANKQLFLDRGCLRRNLFRLGSPDYVSVMPWCEHEKYRQRSMLSGKDDSCIPYPLAVQMTGVDRRPMFLYGEPPLQSSEEYETYVSTLRGRIKPEFLQDNVMGSGGRFAVPFGMEDFCNYDSDDSMPSSREKSIGQVWTDQVDQEMRRIESMEPKKKKKSNGRKRKAPLSAAAKKKKTPKAEVSTQQGQPSKTESPCTKVTAESLPRNDLKAGCTLS